MRLITGLLELALCFIWLYNYHGYGDMAGVGAIVLALVWFAAERWG